MSGLFAVAQSAEMFALTPTERVELARRVVAKVDGRVPVVSAGAFGSSVAEQIKLVHQLADVGVTAVVLLTNQLATLKVKVKTTGGEEPKRYSAKQAISHSAFTSVHPPTKEF